MIGILLITHGSLGGSLAHAAGHVLNKTPERLAVLAIEPGDDPVGVMPRAQAMLDEVSGSGSDGALVLTDMYGGTPSNIASKLVSPGRVEAVSGVNLPMLVRALTYRERDLQTIVMKAVSGGCEGVARVPMFKLHNAATGN